MKTALTVSRADLAALFINPETKQQIFPAEYSNEREPFNVVGPLPPGFFDLSTELLPRSVVETDLTRLQFIPYIVLVDNVNKKFFMYERGADSGEERLIKKYSIGLGGHIEEQPSKWANLAQVTAKAAIRELEEEVGLVFTDSERENMLEGIMQGSNVIYSEVGEVQQVHIGICLFMAVEPQRFGDCEKNVINNGQWITFQEIEEKLAAKEIELEVWSILALQRIQAMEQAQNEPPFVKELNGVAAKVHQCFNKLFVLNQTLGSTDLVQEEWKAFNDATMSLYEKLSNVTLPAPVEADNDVLMSLYEKLSNVTLPAPVEAETVEPVSEDEKAEVPQLDEETQVEVDAAANDSVETEAQEG